MRIVVPRSSGRRDRLKGTLSTGVIVKALRPEIWIKQIVKTDLKARTIVKFEY
jgi:hypothetical protein